MRNATGLISRRSFVRAGLGGLGLLLPLAAACGTPAAPTAAPTAAPAAASKPTTAPAAAPTAAPTAAPAATASAPTAAKPASGGAGKVTIRFLHGREDVTGAAVKAIVERFNAENPGIEVKTEVIGSQAAQIQKQTAQVLVGDPYEVYDNPANRLVGFAREDKLASVADLNKANGGFDPKLYWSPLIEALTWKGRMLGVPLGNAGQGFYTRPDLFEKAGLTAPVKTWAELEQVGPKLTSGDAAAVGLQATEQVWIKVLLRQRGGSVVDKAGTKATMNSPEGVDAMQYLSDLLNKLKIAKVTNGRESFLAGTIAMTTLGEFSVGEMVANKLPHLVSSYPRIKETDDPISPGGFDSLAIFKSTTEKDTAAWKFVSWMAKPEIHFEYWTKPPVCRSPISPAEVDLPAFQEAVKTYSGLATFSKQLPFMFRDPPLLMTGPDIDVALRSAQEAVLLGKKTPRQAMDDATEQANQLLAKEPR